MKKILLLGLLCLPFLLVNKSIASSDLQPLNTLRLGINMHPLQPVHGAPGKVLQQVGLVRSVGTSLIRIDIHWAWIAYLSADPTTWNQSQIDWLNAFLNDIAGSNIEVLAVVTETPCWASADPNKVCTTTARNYDWRYPPSNLQDYANFISELVRRYKGKIKYWEIWNEPNLPYCWTNPNPATYTELLKAAYPAIKAIDSGAIVVGGSLAPWNGNSDYAVNAVNYLDGMYTSGAKGYFDRLSFHPYTDGNSPTWYDARWPISSYSYSVPAIRQKMQEYHDSSLIWLTEVGYTTVPSCEPSLCWTPTLPKTESEQAAYMVDMLNIARTWNYVETLVWYELMDMTDPPDQNVNPEYYFGLFRKDFSPKVAASQLRNIIFPIKVFLPMTIR